MSKRSYPVKPSTRTLKNVHATAAALSTFTDTKRLAEVLGLEYQAAAERIRLLKDSGLYAVEEMQGDRTGQRGARPTLYRATLRQVELPEVNAPEALESDADSVE